MKEYFTDLFVYNNWANEQVINSIITIKDLPEKALLIMSHILDAEITWLCRIKNTVPDVKVWQLYPVTEISGVLKKSSHDLNEFLQGITETDLVKSIEYTNTKEEKFKSSLKDILTHMSHHSAYHRGQVVLQIKTAVSTLPYTDYIHYERNIREN